MMFLGLDPSLRATGWAVLENKENIVNVGTIETSTKDSITMRIRFLHLQVSELIAKYRIKHIFLEDGYCGINGRTALKLGMARGAILAACSVCVKAYPPAVIKQTIVGKGNASKNEMLESVRSIFPNLKITSHDIADAIATVLCGIKEMSSQS